MSDTTEKIDKRRGPRKPNESLPAPLQIDGEQSQIVPRNEDNELFSTPVIEAPRSDATGNLRTVHIKEDGFTALGRVWMRGEELTVEEGSPLYNETCDNQGRSWLDMTETDQYNRFDRLMFGEGPWPHKGFDAAVMEDGSRLTPEEIAKIEAARRQTARPSHPFS